PLRSQGFPVVRARLHLPIVSGFTSLLDEPVEPSTPRGALPARPHADDWQMQTRPYDRKTLTALTSPSALARTQKPAPERVQPAPERVKRSLDNGLSSDTASGVEAFCRGAGIDPSNLPSDAQHALLTMAGQMLREVVLGLMEALKGRADLKSRLRLNQTTIHPT